MRRHLEKRVQKKKKKDSSSGERKQHLHIGSFVQNTLHKGKTICNANPISKQVEEHTQTGQTARPRKAQTHTCLGFFENNMVTFQN